MWLEQPTLKYSLLGLAYPLDPPLHLGSSEAESSIASNGADCEFTKVF